MNINKAIDEISSINKGYKRIWSLSAIIWIILSGYFTNFNSYSYNGCTAGIDAFGGHGFYNSIKEIPIKKLHYCKIDKSTDLIGARYTLDGLRYITIGSLLFILGMPLLIPIFYLVYLWIKEGFCDTD